MGDAAIPDPNGGRLPSILLARRPRLTDSRNDTTATAESKDGHTMAVSFWMAEPPQLSLFSIDASSGFSRSPHLVGADGPFVLLCAVFPGTGFHEYFLYKAGEPPSLERIPSPYELGDVTHHLGDVRELGILGRHRGGDHYLLAALFDARSSDDYRLRIYSSETKSWSTRTLHNPCPGVDRVFMPDKVISLGQDGLLGWVDLLHGLLVCDLPLLLQDQDPPVPGAPGAVSFIPLPELLPGNKYKLKYPIVHYKMEHNPLARDCRLASWFRDLACVNGVLKFVDMENPAPPQDKDNRIYDSDLIMSLKRKAVDVNSTKQLSSFRDAWRAVTWSRKVSSSNYWRQTCAAQVADIKGQELTFMDLYSAFPILSPEDGDDILYLRSLVEPVHKDGWVAAVDIGNKAIKAIGNYYLPYDFYYRRGYDPEHPFRASTLSRYLDMTPGNQVSACRKQTEAERSANRRSRTSVCVSSCERRAKTQRLLEMAGKTKRAQNSPGSITQNHRISQVRPIEINLAPQASFNNFDGPASFHGYPQQLSAPNSFAYGAHTGYVNYQQQWRQLPPTLELPIIGASWQHPPPPGSGAASANNS